MKRTLLAYLLFASIGLLAQDIVILHTNDIHAHLNGLSPETEFTPFLNDNDCTQGGFSRIAGYIKSEKEKYGDKLLVVDAGDFLMGTFFQTLETTQGFELNLMKRMGYDYVSIGNHEFDFGPNGLATIISNSKLNSDIPQLLLANYKTAKGADDQSLKALFADSTILPYTVVEKNGYRIGIFALMGIDASESIAGIYGVSFFDPIKTAKKTASFLKQNEKVDLVIALSHCGVEKNKDNEWAGEDVKLGEKVADIDFIIGAHSHSCLPEMLKAGNAVVVQTGSSGLNMGCIEIKFNSKGKPEVQYKLLPMNDEITADVEIQRMIDEKSPVIEKNILSKMGVTFSQPIAETSFDLFMDETNSAPSNLGPLVSDAIYNRLNAKDAPGVDIAMVAAGVIRNNIVKGNTGKQNINDLFNVMSLGMGFDDCPGYPLAKIYLTGRELKKVIELILAVAPSKNSYYLYFSGCKIDYNPQKGLFKKISDIQIGNELMGYKTVSFSKKSEALLSIAANSYMIGFIGTLKKMSHGIVNVQPKNADGSLIVSNNFLVDLDKNKENIQEAKEWQALYYLLSNFPDTNGNGIPDIPELYKTKRNPLLVKK